MQEINAVVNVNNEEHTTPFSIDLPEGTYNIYAVYNGKRIDATVIIQGGKRTVYNFEFGKTNILPSILPFIFGIGLMAVVK